MSPLEDGGPLAQLNKCVIRILIVDLVTCTSLIPKLWKESQILSMKMWMLKCWEGLIVKMRCQRGVEQFIMSPYLKKKTKYNLMQLQLHVLEFSK